jgi:hypothetical protein
VRPARAARSLVALLLASFAAACAPNDPRVVIRELRSELAQQYHECVPLGWNPVPVAGTYYPGTNVVLEEQGNGRVWLPALWIARIPNRLRARDAGVRAAAEVLDELARAGMIDRHADLPGSTYRLTPAAMPYFFSENAHGSNPPAFPYLCYSTIVPERVVATDPVHTMRLAGGLDAQVFHATFTWTASEPAAWARSPFMRAHSVVLGPSENPLTAELVRTDGSWHVVTVRGPTSQQPHVVDASVWPPAPPPLRGGVVRKSDAR